jgi:predicted peptidase
MAILLLLPTVLLTIVAAMGAEVPRELSALLDKKVFEGASGAKMPYRLLRPDPYEDGKTYPLVVLLHGAGERGDNNEAQLIHGVGEFARPDRRKKYPCFLVAPQCPRGKAWSSILGTARGPTLSRSPSQYGALVLELIAQLQKEFRVDPERIYLTGLSMGGYGTWDLLMRRPDLFAAAVPICGGGDETQASRIASIPIWVFHGALDRGVPVERSRAMVAALEKAGGTPRYTEYPDEGHESWVPAYRSPALFRWLFSQKKAGQDAKSG